MRLDLFISDFPEPQSSLYRVTPGGFTSDLNSVSGDIEWKIILETICIYSIEIIKRKPTVWYIYPYDQAPRL